MKRNFAEGRTRAIRRETSPPETSGITTSENTRSISAPCSVAICTASSLDAEPDVPTFSLGDAEDQDAAPPPAAPAAPAEPAPPAFSLDEAAEPAPPAFTVEPEPPAPAGAAFSDAPPADDGPLFDLSSELEGQLPSYGRPAAPAETEPDEELFTLLPPAPSAGPAPAVPAADEAAPAFDLDPGDPAPADPLAAFAAPPAPEPEPAPLDLGGGALFDEFGVAPTMTHLADDGAGDEGGHSDVFQRRVFESMLSTLMEMVTEIRRSLEYYTGREPDHPIARIILFGGTSRLP